MAESITCPSCRATITDDGEKVIKRSPRISQLEALREELEVVKGKLSALEASRKEKDKGGDDDDW